VTFYRASTEPRFRFDDVASFEEGLKDPSSELGFLSRFFDADGDVILVRVPARLDVMGGIADYSGSLVCEGTLSLALVMGVQLRQDRIVRVHSHDVGRYRKELAPNFQMSLDDLRPNGSLIDYEQARSFFKKVPQTAWAGYAAGALYVLMQEVQRATLTKGANIALVSNVPIGAGIASSATVEVAAMHALSLAYDVPLEGKHLSRLAQIVENKVVGAPCGLMDQLTEVLGEEGTLLPIKCQPDIVMEPVKLPESWGVVGINSRVKHNVAGSAYRAARVGAFMGHRIILTLMEQDGLSKEGEDPLNGYLCRLSVSEFRSRYASRLPSEITGQEFLCRYHNTLDPVTTVEPGKLYKVRSRASHPIYENERVAAFLGCMRRAASNNDDSILQQAGHLMFGSHWSYRNRCGLDSPETWFIVQQARRIGPAGGLYGAHITGGGSGGTVAVLGRMDRMMGGIEQLVEAYRNKTGIDADVFTGSSPGALAFGHLRYARS
jgi:L-arabinokinase